MSCNSRACGDAWIANCATCVVNLPPPRLGFGLPGLGGRIEQLRGLGFGPAGCHADGFAAAAQDNEAKDRERERE